MGLTKKFVDDLLLKGALLSRADLEVGLFKAEVCTMSSEKRVILLF